MRRLIFASAMALCLGGFLQQGAAAERREVKLRIYGDIDTAAHTNTLLVLRQGDMYNTPTAVITVEGGKVDHTLTLDDGDKFSLDSRDDLFRHGTWRPMDFFSEDGELHISGTPFKDDPRTLSRTLLQMEIVGATGPLNSQLMEYNREYNTVWRPQQDSVAAIESQLTYEETYSPEGQAFWKSFEELLAQTRQYPDSLPLLEMKNRMFHLRDSMDEAGIMYTPRYNALMRKYREIAADRIMHDIRTYATPEGGTFGLGILMDCFSLAQEDSLKNKVIDTYLAHYQAPFANTTMGRRMDNTVTGYEVKRIGGRYPDYELPDADGTLHRIRDLMGGKITLVDLWGSSCGPCRVNSRSVIPIYNEFKDRGFNVVGIAREYKNLDAFHNAVKKDGYPWQQLVELDDAHDIFNLHGIPMAMGGTYLVGQDGRILLINPTPEALRAYLADNL